ncbi:ATPase [Aliivibrio sp. S4TY2]|uniref:Dph6-related ATP pyrophosphatase n=1 Tax=unclassified Aliivibrio TaxID=2645654 RepID=UPI0023799B93|nr:MULTISPECIES: ATPase [unclassified Aliivibrio]MDD9157726.1 ATPase [Aliivibrio sp. S4TY2]MDD9161697.1 ATPase [Aliivibrio sp. S4TY1]MDD9165727.1 ATPase [Aliivibrio sp. S4MY2]MDD9169726.1 ATPase [Aliivibrio sp. S4MY4]MDD9186794.1 ATPase [Aliivibrio sp. S4MY3]
MKKKVIISWSSGKDSTLTLIRLLNNPEYEVVALYTTHVANEVPFQVTSISVVQMQADLAGLPVITIELPTVFPANNEYQSLVVTGLKECGIEFDAVAFGDMFCNGIVEYRKSYIEAAGWECVFPLVGQSSRELAEEIINCGIKTILVTTDGTQLDNQFCGQEYTMQLLSELPGQVDPCGEDGEFHTLVIEAPCFHGSIELSSTTIDEQERFTHLRYQASVLQK